MDGPYASSTLAEDMLLGVCRIGSIRHEDVLVFYSNDVGVPLLAFSSTIPLAFSSTIKDMKGLLHNA
jgi:hypothetical protein